MADCQAARPTGSPVVAVISRWDKMRLMRLGLKKLVGFALWLGLMTGVSPSANCPQWRGPNLNGSTTTAHDLPVTWSETENVLWRAKMPSWSAATPIVWEDTIFVTSAEPGSPLLGKGRHGPPPRTAPDKLFLLALN